MVKFYIYNTSNDSVLDLGRNKTSVLYKPFNGSITQQWEFTPSLEHLGWTIKNAGTKTGHLQPAAKPPPNGIFLVCTFDPFFWKFKSSTVLPVADSLFTLEHGEFAMTVSGTSNEAILTPAAGQITSGTQVWQLKAV